MKLGAYDELEKFCQIGSNKCVLYVLFILRYSSFVVLKHIVDVNAKVLQRVELLVWDDCEIGKYTRPFLGNGSVNMFPQQQMDMQQ